MSTQKTQPFYRAKTGKRTPGKTVRTQVATAKPEKTVKFTQVEHEVDGIFDYEPVLDIDDKRVSLKILGAGQVTTAYSDVNPPHDVYAFVRGGSPDKDIAAAAKQHRPMNLHLPEVEKLGRTDEDTTVYKMPLYRVPVRKGSKARQEYEVLKGCADNLTLDWLTGRPTSTESAREYMASCAKERDVKPAVRAALDELLAEAAQHSSTYVVDLHGGNVAQDKSGRLILLDVLYDPAAYKRPRSPGRPSTPEGWHAPDPRFQEGEF